MPKKKIISVLFLAVIILFIVVFFYLDRTNALSAVIQNWGWPGTVLAILFMAVLCLTPVPSEGFLLMLMKIYGVFFGIFLSWLGLMLSTLIIFLIARLYGLKLVEKIMTPERFETVNHWVDQKGTFGLLVARLLPVPAFVVNYAAGVIPSIRLWPYFWTAAVSIIPYYLGTSFLFLGVARETWYWLFFGCLALIAVWAAGYLLNRKKPLNRRPQNDTP